MKRILGLDLGTASIGWALVDEADPKNKDEQSSIIKLGVRVIQYDNFSVVDRKSGKISESKKPYDDFKAGKGLSPNASRTSKRGARRNLQRYKLRREDLMAILLREGFITDDTLLTEIGKNTTHQTLAIRAKSATEEVTLKEFARILMTINKKRGYKSSRKTSNEEEGQAIDGMAVAKELYDRQLTPGQYVYELLTNEKKYIPDFYRSDLQREFDLVWACQKQYYPEVLNDKLYNELQGKGMKQTWAICKDPMSLVGIKIKEDNKELKGAVLKKKKYEYRGLGISQKLELEYVAIVLQEINNNLNKSSGYLGAISDRSKVLYFNNITVGQYLYQQIKTNPHTSLKNQVFYRQDYLDEFEQIWETQAKFHSQLTDKLKEEIRDVVIFYQRKLKSQKGLLSFCQFESWEEERKDSDGNPILNPLTGNPKKRRIGRRVASKSSPLFQESKIWQDLNNLQFSRRDGLKKDLFNQEVNEKYVLEDEDRQLLFDELNLRGKLKEDAILKLLGLHKKEWKTNFSDGIDGNSTNQALFNIYQAIAENEGYGHDWAKKKASEIRQELKDTFPLIGIDASILDFDANLDGEAFDKQSSYQLWHLLYSAEEDDKVSEEDKVIYGNASVSLKKKLCTKYGFMPQYASMLANIRLSQDYGNLSSKALRKIMPFLQAGHQYSEACSLSGYNHSHSLTKEELEARILKPKLDILKKNSLRNPVVEKILNQMVNLVNQVIDTYGKPDEVRIELARELKKSAKERDLMTKGIAEATRRNDDIRKVITSKFGIPNPTKTDVVRYRLWQELEHRGHKTLFTNEYISPEMLFSKNVDIEHIIPKALLFDDSFSNKTLAIRQVNLKKGDRTALDFITQDYGSEVEAYQVRVEELYQNKIISKAKRNKLLMSQAQIPDGFIERDLRNSQYIAKKAKSMLWEVFDRVISTSGSVTDKLREDWGLINMMKELNLPKYRALGLTEMEKRLNKQTGKLVDFEVIKDWSKRNDHRHHAMDALTVAFTTHNHIQYINNLNASRSEHSELYGIRNTITHKDESGKRRFIPPMDNFRSEAKKQVEAILISFKAKNKVVTRNINKTKGKNGKWNTKIQLTPRGQLHKETVYGKSLRKMAKPTKVNKKLTIGQIEKVINHKEKEILKSHLAKYDNNTVLAFDTKTIKKDPILLNDEPLKEVYCFEEIYTIRKDISPDLKIDKVLDEGVKRILQERLDAYGNKPKEAFSDLEKNPIWLNKEKGITIKRVTITGVSNAEALHVKKDQLGNPILNAEGHEIPTDYVSTGNNHHVAIYKDADGNLQEKVVSFYEAVARIQSDLPIIDKEYRQDDGWEFLFTMKQNEMFVFPSEDFNPSEIDLKDKKNASLVSKHLFRVQKISSKDYLFTNHLETQATTGEIMKHKKNLSGITYNYFQSTGWLEGIVKVRLNHLGEIVHVGEY